SFSNPSHGSVVANVSDGRFTYTPDHNFYGSDAFTYDVTNGIDTETGTVAIEVTHINQPPTATADAYATGRGTQKVVSAPGILTNDSDVDSVTLSAHLVNGPSHGSFSLNTDGGFSYTPNAHFLGNDTFSYQAGDGQALSDSQTVTITVSDPNN